MKYAQLKNLQGALTDYNRAIQLDPNLANSYNNRAFISYDLGNMTAAANDWKKAIDLDPLSNADPYMGLAVISYRQGDYRQANSLRIKALKLDPKYSELQYLQREAAWSDEILKDTAAFFKRDSGL